MINFKHMAAVLSLSCLPLVASAQLFVAPDSGTTETTDESTATEDNMIVLSDNASDTGKERSAHGMETANDARANGSDFGKNKSREAKD